MGSGMAGWNSNCYILTGRVSLPKHQPGRRCRILGHDTLGYLTGAPHILDGICPIPGRLLEISNRFC